MTTNDKVIKAWVAELLAVQLPAGVLIDRIIGYGSFWWGGYREAESDIDIAVILCRLDGLQCSDIDKYNTFFNVTHACLVVDVLEIERYRNLTTVLFGKIIARGALLYCADATESIRKNAAENALPYAVARGQWVAKCRREAGQVLQELHEAMRLLTPLRAHARVIASSAQFAAVLLLWSVLIEFDMDPSDKRIRWNVAKLTVMAVEQMPELEPLVNYVRGVADGAIRDRYEYDDYGEAKRLLRLSRELMGVLGAKVN